MVQLPPVTQCTTQGSSRARPTHRPCIGAGFNRIATIVPEAMAACPGLGVLDVSNNNIKALPSTIDHLTALHTLDVSNNDLSGTVPPSRHTRFLLACEPTHMCVLSRPALPAWVRQKPDANRTRGQSAACPAPLLGIWWLISPEEVLEVTRS